MINLIETKALFTSKLDGAEDFRKACIELYYWQHSYTGCFSNMVFDLISKARSTPSNRKRLMRGFPEQMMAYKYWESIPPDIFYELVKEKIDG